MKEYKSHSYERVLTVKETNASFNKVKIISSKDASTYARQFYHDDLEIFESFFIILLNRQNNTLGWAKISQGGIVGTVVDTKIIAKFGIEVLASNIILVHNHPSGNLTPSNADKEMTNKIKQTLAIVEIQITDHIIITKDSYFSFADEGLI